MHGSRQRQRREFHEAAFTCSSPQKFCIVILHGLHLISISPLSQDCEMICGISRWFRSGTQRGFRRGIDIYFRYKGIKYSFSSAKDKGPLRGITVTDHFQTKRLLLLLTKASPGNHEFRMWDGETQHITLLHGETPRMLSSDIVRSENHISSGS